MKRIASNILIGLLPLLAAAQDLSKEITVDRVVVPEPRQAERLSLMPAITAPQQEEISVAAAEYLQPGTILNSVPRLAAAPWQSTVEHTPYRGYASVGYFPLMNVGANAGIRFLDAENYNAGVFAQSNGYSYKHDGVKLRNNFCTVGAYGAWRPNAFSRLSADITYDYAGILHPSWVEENKGYSRSTNAIDATVGWASKPGDFFYAIKAKAGMFNFGNSDAVFMNGSEEFKPLHQSYFGFDGSVGAYLHDNPLKIDFDGTWLNSTALSKYNLGEVHLRPNFTGKWHSFAVRLGVNMSIATGDDTKVHVAPDVEIAWASTLFPLSAYVKFDGGEKLNPASEIFAVDPYVTPFLPNGRTNVPFAVEAGVNIGRIAGFSFDVIGKYASAKNALMPFMLVAPDNEAHLPVWTYPYGGTVYAGSDMKSWSAGLRLGYAYRELFDITAEGAVAGSNEGDHTWYQWYDNAKYTLDVKANITPMEKLKVEVGYNLRALRKGQYDADKYFNLGNMSNLWAGASYRVYPQFTVFLRAENLLCHRYMLVSDLPSQSIHGLAGVAIKF